MGKRLITVKNLFEYIQDKELVVQADMIITPGAKDIIREQGVEVRYEKSFCESNCESENKVKNEIKKDCEDLERKVIEILVKDYKITDFETVQKILSKLKELR